MKTVSIILPAINEAEGIGCTLDALPLAKLSEMGYATEVLVVDGNSKDNTVDIASSKGAQIVMEPRKGYGRAYKTGFQYARGDYFVTMDADGSYPADAIPLLLTRLVDGNLDLITTCRLDSPDPGAMSASHRVGNEILNLFCRVLFRLKFRDSQSGMWIFRRTLLGRVGVEADGMAFSQEFKIRSFQTASCQEIPIHYKARIGSQKLSAVSDGLANLKNLVGLAMRPRVGPMISLGAVKSGSVNDQLAPPMVPKTIDTIKAN